MIRNIFIGTIILLLLTSFQQPKPKSITGKWSLLSYTDVNTGQIVFTNSIPGYYNNNGITYQFTDDGEKGEISGNNFCNTAFGSYELENPNIIKEIYCGGTEMYCPQYKYIRGYSLANANKYNVSNDTLTFTYKNNAGVMIFLKVK